MVGAHTEHMTKPSLAETHPEIAAQARGWDATTVTFVSWPPAENL